MLVSTVQQSESAIKCPFFAILFTCLLTVVGLHRYAGFFSSCEWGLLSSCGVWASQCAGFSHCRAAAPGAWALGVADVVSVAVAPGL